MSQELYSVEEVADLLKLHVKTVRNYVRTGRLQAKRIGKQYRIAKEQVEALVGRSLYQFDPTSPDSHGRVAVCSVVQIEALSRAAADRLTTLLLGAMKGLSRDRQSLRLESMYDEEHNQLKLVVFGGLRPSAALLGLITDVIATADAE